MTNYRRTHVPGATWFFTVNLAERRSRLLVDRIDALREALRYVRTRHPFQTDAMVVLPDHLHAIWTLPPGDSDYPHVGGCSRPGSPVMFLMVNADDPVGLTKANVGYGNADTGSA